MMLIYYLKLSKNEKNKENNNFWKYKYQTKKFYNERRIFSYQYSIFEIQNTNTIKFSNLIVYKNLLNY